MPYEIYELTPEQKEIVLANYATLDHQELTRLVYKNDTLDGRSTEGKSIKAFLAGVGKTVRPAKYNQTGPKLELTEEQKKTVEQLASRTESSIELTRLVFKDETVKHLSHEWRAVYAYLKEVYPEGIKTNEEPVDEQEYTPPATVQSLIGVLNKYVPTGEINKNVYTFGKLKTSEERCLRALMSYIRIPRFKYQAGQYEKQMDRELYLSTFMRWTHDKPDLTQIEQDQMISAAAETVNIAQIDRSIQRVDKMQEQAMAAGGWVEETGDDGTPKKRKFNMADVELINGMRTKFDAAKKQLQELMKKLETSRAERNEDRDKRNSSILNLFDAWQKDEEKRMDLIEQGIKEHEEDAREVGRLTELDDITALIAGQTKEEARGGM